MTELRNADGARRAADVVRGLWGCFEARDWDGAGALLADDVVIVWPATRERISGRHDVVELNSNYPEPWGHITVERVVVTGEQVAAEVRIDAPAGVFWCAGFYDVRAGRIVRATEYWVTEGGEAPETDRSRWTTPY